MALSQVNYLIIPVSVEALDVVYGIYSQAINGAVNVDYINNTILANAHTAYAMELWEMMKGHWKYNNLKKVILQWV